MGVEARLECMRQEREAEVKHKKAMDELEAVHAERLSEVETKKFGALVEAIGPDTITAIARAGPEMQAKLLGGLGLQGYLVTDGKSPINLLQTASGLIGGGDSGAPGLGSFAGGV